MAPITSIIALFVLAVAIRSSLRLMYGMRQSRDGDILHSILVIVSWTCMICSLVAFSALFLWLFAIPMWIFIGVTLLTAYVRYGQMQRKTLLALMATVAEKDLPPGPALQAFADGHANAIGRAASRMAQLVDQGASLPTAITLCESSLPRFTRVFTQAGEVSKNFVRSLREVNQLESAGHIVAQSLAGRLFYLFFVGNAWIFVGTFTLQWIVPKLRKIFADFGVALPELTQMVIDASDLISNFGILLFPFFLLFLVFPLLLLFLWKLYDFQWIGGVPVVEQWNTSLHRAVILRSLALAAEKDQPLGPVLRSLSMNYPRAFIGRRLWNVAGDVEAGGVWYDSLRQENLLGPGDVAVLKSAERVGNLSWAMRMVAERGIRRTAYRMQALLNWVSPLIVVAIGLAVMFFVVGMFLPLIKIIQSVSQF